MMPICYKNNNDRSKDLSPRLHAQQPFLKFGEPKCAAVRFYCRVLSAVERSVGTKLVMTQYLSGKV